MNRQWRWLGRQSDCVCLLSLNTEAYSPERIGDVIRHSQALGCRLRFVCLDSLERVNMEVIGAPARKAEDLRAAIMSARKSGPVTFEVASAIEATPGYTTMLALIQGEFATSRAFRNACLTQTFRSLQPKLKQLGVPNQRHPIVLRLADYTVRELALLGYLGTVEQVSVEISYHSEMLPFRFLSTNLRRQVTFPRLAALDASADDTRPRTGLKLEGWEVAIGAGRRSVGPIDLHILPGTVCALIGPNGAGKSTLLRSIAGHLPSTAGRLLIDGADVSTWPPYRRQAATVFQDGGLFPEMDAQANISLGARAGARRSNGVTVSVSAYLQRFGMQTIAQRRPRDLSGGEAQITALARAIAAYPAILLLDEPTASLDTLKRRSLAAWLLETVERRRLPCLVVSHDREFLLSIATGMLVLDEQGRPVEVVNDLRSREDDGNMSMLSANLLGTFNIFRATHEANYIQLWSGETQFARLNSGPSHSAGICFKPEAVRVANGVATAPVVLMIEGIVRRRSQDGRYAHLFLSQPGDDNRMVSLTVVTETVGDMQGTHARFAVAYDNITWLY